MKHASLAFILLLSLIGLAYPLAARVHAPLPSPTQLTFNTSSDFSPAISSDGLKIAFSSKVDGDFEIYTVNPDGTGLRKVTSNNNNDTSPSISANGGKIAFQSVSGNDADIFVVNSDGTGLLRLTQNNVDDTDPVISGDGQWIAFVSNDNPTGQNPEGDPEIFLVKSDGTSLRQLTVNTKTDLSPSITANGGKVAFQTNIAGTYEIFVINSDGTGLRQLTSNDGDDTSPSISSDGSKVAFDSRAPATLSFRSIMRIGPESLIPSNVYVVNSNGSGLTQVSATGGDNFAPSLSGDGRKVAYVSTGDGNWEVYVVNSDGTGVPVRITNNTVLDVDPSLDSNGGSVVFASNLDGDFEIFISHPPTTVHDMAVVGIVVPRRVGYNIISSNPLRVNVTVENQGTVADTVRVELSFLSGQLLGNQNVTISPGTSQIVVFNLATQGLALGSYTLVANAVPLLGEADTADNRFVDGPVQVHYPGDVDGDRDVDIIDAATLAFAYGKACGVAGYLDAADLDNDCDIDIIDAATLAFYYGTVIP